MGKGECWSVAVNVGGEHVLSIGHNWLSGVDNIGDHRDTIRDCALHLLAFIGCDEKGDVVETEGVDFAAELKTEQDNDRWAGNLSPDWGEEG